jgi:hypothetical protein
LSKITNQPTNKQRNKQTNKPTNQPTNHPTNKPTNQPTNQPTSKPNKQTSDPCSPTLTTSNQTKIVRSLMNNIGFEQHIKWLGEQPYKLQREEKPLEQPGTLLTNSKIHRIKNKIMIINEKYENTIREIQNSISENKQIEVINNKNYDDSEPYYIQANKNGIGEYFNNNKIDNDNILLSSLEQYNLNKQILNKNKPYNGSMINF